MNELSDRILRITRIYLGPASEIFLKRQASGHMNGLDFEQIKPEHLQTLFRWIHSSSKLIIKDKADLLLHALTSALKNHLPEEGAKTEREILSPETDSIK